MTWSSSALSASEIAAAAADKHMVLARNVVRDNVFDAIISDTNGRWTDTDITDPDYPTTELCNGRGHTGAKNTSTTAQAVYFVFRLDGSAFDSAMVLFADLPFTCTVTLEIDDNDNGSFSATTTLASWAGVDGSSRLVDLSLHGGSWRYSGGAYLRLKVDRGAPNLGVVHLAEFWLARRRQLLYGLECPTDDQATESDVTEFVARSRATQRIVHATRARSINGELLTADNDDTSTVRSIWDDSEDGTEPVVYVPNPNSSPTDAFLGYLQPGLRMDAFEADLRRTPFSFLEVPPFRDGES